MTMRVVVLGAGFGGLELSTRLSEQLGEAADVVLIDAADSFVFGFSKLDVMFGRTTADAVRHPYRDVVQPGVRFVNAAVRSIDPRHRAVETDAGSFEGDVLVVALGADLDPAATPGLLDAGHEFYTVAGAFAARAVLERFEGGRVIVGVTSTPFKCPPAPSETALLLHDYLLTRGLRDASEITFTIPLGSPVPPSPETSRALVQAFAERDIAFVPGRRVSSLDGERGMVLLDDGAELPYDLFLGVPKHRAPTVVTDSGLAEDGYVPVEARTLRTRFDDVYAIGDVAQVGVPKAGVFAEGAAKIVADQLIARARKGTSAARYEGRGSCYIEFGGGRVGRVDVDFMSGPEPSGVFQEPSAELVAEKRVFGDSRRERWFSDRS
jgi:sulfide:quinone oxidoreductase